jgi:hypothetical protein
MADRLGGDQGILDRASDGSDVQWREWSEIVMFRLEDVQERLKKRPFEPFRIHLTDGRSYDVDYPELCMLGRTTLHVAVRDPKRQQLILRVDQCALVHVVSLEPLNGDRPTKSRRKNGQKE